MSTKKEILFKSMKFFTIQRHLLSYDECSTSFGILMGSLKKTMKKMILEYNKNYNMKI